MLTCVKMTGTRFDILLNPRWISYVGCSNWQANKLARESHSCKHTRVRAHTQWTNQNWGSGSPWLLASAPVTVRWEQEAVLAPFHRQWVARRQPWKVPWGSCHSPLPWEVHHWAGISRAGNSVHNTGAQCEWTKVVKPWAPHLMQHMLSSEAHHKWARAN